MGQHRQQQPIIDRRNSKVLECVCAVCVCYSDEVELRKCFSIELSSHRAPAEFDNQQCPCSLSSTQSNIY